MENSSLDDSSVDIELVHPIRLDDIDSGVPQSSQNSFNHITQLTGISTSARAHCISTRDQSFISMQLTCGDGSTDDCMDIETFAISAARNSRVGSAPAIPHHRHNTASLSLEALTTSPVGSLVYSSGSKNIRRSASPISAGSSKNTYSHKAQLDPPTNTPSVSGRIYRGSSPIESPAINQNTKYPTQLSRRSAFSHKKNDAIYTMTKIPQVVCFTSASPAKRSSERSSLSAVSAQALHKQPSPTRYSFSSRSASIRQEHKSPGLYPLSCANKFYKEASHVASSRSKLSAADNNNCYAKTPTMQLRPSPRSKSPTRPTTVSSSFPSAPLRKPNSSKRTTSPINNTPTMSPNRGPTTRPCSHLIIRPSPFLKLGGALNSPYSSLTTEFPLQIRNIGHSVHRSSTGGASMSNTPNRTEITIHKDKRFRPVSPDGNTFITIFSPTINNPNNPVTFHLNDTTLVTKTSVGWVKLNTDYERTKSNNIGSPRRSSATNKFN